MLQAILNCVQASFNHFELNCDVWLLVRTYCRGLLGSEELERYRELYEKHNDDKNRPTEWADLLEKFYPDDDFFDAGRYDHLEDDYEVKEKVTRERAIAYHQLKACPQYLEDRPAEFAAYREFLVSVFYFGACVYYFCRDNNLTPSSFCRFTTVVRLLPTGRLGSQ